MGHVKKEQSYSVFNNPPVTDRHYVMTRHTVCSALVNVLFYPALVVSMKGLIYISTCNVVITRAVMKINRPTSQHWSMVGECRRYLDKNEMNRALGHLCAHLG